jgi:hypothetical protein
LHRRERRARWWTCFIARSRRSSRRWNSARLLLLGFDPVASTPEQFGAWMRTEIAKWGKVIRDSSISAQ